MNATALAEAPSARPRWRAPGGAQEPACEVESIEEIALWRRYSAQRDPRLREQLIRRYLPLCKTIAAVRYAARAFDDAEYADYLQLASLGLIEAVDAFDWRRGVRFNTFASYRIEGSIRNRIASFSERREQAGLLSRLKNDGSPLAEQEVGQRLSRTRGRGARGRQLRSLADTTVVWALTYLLEGSGMFMARHDPQYVEHFYGDAERKEREQRLLRLVEQLPEREKRIIKFHYLQNIELTEVGRLFGITKGRVSQLRKRALAQLREAHHA